MGFEQIPEQKLTSGEVHILNIQQVSKNGKGAISTVKWNIFCIFLSLTIKKPWIFIVS